ncbi:MAG: phosphatidate cytidylyltransferase, partial [Treponema sp.]|nr:phosphatidate cytidylyltransferase [Treponema sp.]
ELYDIFRKNSPMLPKPLVVILNALLPASTYVFILLGLPFSYISWVFMMGALILMGYEALTAKTFEYANTSVTLSVFILFYCGFLVTFISRMTIYDNAVNYIAVFLFMVFICDSAAWLFGMLFGKNNRGIVSASPNKSAAGFIGGYAGCIGAAVLTQTLWPDIFRGGLWKSFIFGALIATSAIVGDLIESVFKRSANVKDSGFIMPGRGGVLDSIDSVLFSAPVFYVALHIFYGVELF